MLNHRIPGFVNDKTKAFPHQVSTWQFKHCY
jgi:hypothetical protein